MATSKHAKSLRRRPPRDDLEENPGIGSGRGASAGKGEPDPAAGESTFEGDVANDTNPQGGIDPRHIGRTNK
jgi:hypothetical protein